jgi:hypothetical protein
MPDNFSPSLTDLARRLFGRPDLPPQLHDALAAVRQQGVYYGGWPQVPGPSVRPGLAVDPARFPVITGPRMKEPPGMGLIGANQNVRASMPRPEITERLGVLNKLIANRDFRPTVYRGKLYFRSLSPQENEIMHRIGWARAPNVEWEDEISDDPLTSLRAWERNIRHWHKLASPPEE